METMGQVSIDSQNNRRGVHMAQDKSLKRKRRKLILRVHIHQIDKQVDPDDFNSAVDSYADWKIKAYLQKQNGAEAPKESVRTDIEEDWWF